MPEAADITFELERSEYLTAGGEIALVRVTGRWRADHLIPLGPVRLCAAAGSDVVVADPLPDPSAPEPAASLAGEDWRGAYGVPLRLIGDEQAAFWVEAGGVHVLVPHPVPQGEPAARRRALGVEAAEPRRWRFPGFGRPRAGEPADDTTEAALEYERNLRQAVERDLQDQLAEKQAMRGHLHRLMLQLEQDEREAGLPALSVPYELRRRLDEGLDALDDLEVRIAALRDAATGDPREEALREEVLRRIDALDALERRLTAVRHALDGGPG